jgi:gamma-glutamyl phosphate reductase
MFYRLAMWRIQARAGISTKSWSSRFNMSGRNKLKLEFQRACGPMKLDELTSYKWIGIGNGQIRT